MLYLNNPFTKEITEFNGEVFKELNAIDGKIYLSNGAIIKQVNEGKYFDISTNTEQSLKLKIPMRSVLFSVTLS